MIETQTYRLRDYEVACSAQASYRRGDITVVDVVGLKALQCLRCDGDPNATNAQRERKSILCETKGIGFLPIPGHQQPASRCSMAWHRVHAAAAATWFTTPPT